MCKKIFVKKSQELLISRRLSSLPLHTWKMVTLSSHRNFSAQTDQVPHVCPVLGFPPPASEADALCRSKPCVPKLACRVLRLQQLLHQQQIVPSRRCLWTFGSVCARLCVFLPTLPPQWQRCWIPASLPSCVLRSTIRHCGPEKQRRKWLLVLVSPRKSSFPGSWYSAERPMQLCVQKWTLHLLFFATGLLQLDTDQALVPLLMLWRTGDPVISMTA